MKDGDMVEMSVGVEDGKVVLEFGEPTERVEMTSQQASNIAAALIHIVTHDLVPVLPDSP